MEKYAPYSELKAFHHIDRINGILKNERVAPIYIRIKPTNVCNQRCYYCGYADDQLYDGRKVDKRESIPWEILEHAIQELAEMGVKAVTFSGGGEPLCYQYIEKALELVRKYGIDYSMITNGQALKGTVVNQLKDAKWVRISFDSCMPQTYEAIRGVQTYREVVRNIEHFAQVKENCTIGINCVVTKQNADQVYEVCRIAKEIGADNIKLSPILVKGRESTYHSAIRERVSEQILLAKEQLETDRFTIVDKYTSDLSFEEDFQKPYHRCVIQEIFAVIAADSKVYRCHQRAYTKPGELGDLSHQSFKEIWYSGDTIKNVCEFDPYTECPFRCAFDERNMLLNQFVMMDKEHINFI